MPSNPDAWLIATAQRRLMDGDRRAAVRVRLELDFTYAGLGRMEEAGRARARAAGLTRDPAIRACLLRKDVAGRAIDR